MLSNVWMTEVEFVLFGDGQNRNISGEFSVFSKYLKGFAIASRDFDIIMEHLNLGRVLFCKYTSMTLTSFTKCVLVRGR